MYPSVRALLTGIVDYAGLFPPANLPLDEAIRHYARYRARSDSWMLGRFICPAARLAELGSLVTELFPTGPPLAVSALGRGGSSAQEFLAALTNDLDEIGAFRRNHAGRVTVDVFEVRLPATVIGADARPALASLVEAATTAVARCGGLQVYYEPAFADGWRADLPSLFTLISGGIKMRCGGLEATAFPSTEQLGFALGQCRERGLRLKATAGLHHPLRHVDAGLRVKMHGFINLFGAGVLAQVHRLGEGELKQILDEEDAGNFIFDEAGFGWKQFRATTAQIGAARASFVTSFGSCSFDEPREDLRALGWLS